MNKLHKKHFNAKMKIFVRKTSQVCENISILNSNIHVYLWMNTVGINS